MMKKLFQTECPAFICTFLVCAVTLFSGCDLKNYESPQGYDLGRPQKFELGKVLNEISGISYNLNDSSLLGISDSKRKVFEISLKRVRLRDYTGDIIGPDQDLEDIVNMEKIVYLLSSKGMIYEVPLNGDTIAVNSYALPLEGKNDFETLYYDPSANGLIMLCKECASDKGEQRRSAFRFDLETKQFDTIPYYSISTVEVKALLKNDDAKFDPSAATIHPVNKKLYILSSAGNLMVIADAKGKPL
ncbi:MAG TPA: SdiA-regulated domain-containing protein, partial [Chitinophagaceae bacterium]|nr:SdiA-regulated domain-containing protein [Chitinophagaceae bacterium]